MKLVYLIIFAISLPVSESLFCACNCQVSNTSCINQLSTGCTVAASTVYSAPYTVLTGQAINYYAYNTLTALNGYYSTNTTPVTCTISYTLPSVMTVTYRMPGRYASYDYLWKNYTLPNNHYKVLIRFSLAYIGVWGSTDFMMLTINDGWSSYYYNFSYNCVYTEMICSTRLGNNVDCFDIREYQILHNSTMLLLNFSSLTFIADTNVQFWSVKDVMIVTFTCDISCATCFAGNSSSCYTCTNNFYLNGNSCVGTCPAVVLLNTTNNLTGICLASCPLGFYTAVVPPPVNAPCLACPVGCLNCYNSTYCYAWSTDNANAYSTWYQYLAIWVVLIIIGILLIAGIIYWLACTKKPISPSEKERIFMEDVNQTKGQFQNDEKVTDHRSDKGYPFQTRHVHIQEIDFNDNVKVDSNPRKRKRQLEKEQGYATGTNSQM